MTCAAGAKGSDSGQIEVSPLRLPCSLSTAQFKQNIYCHSEMMSDNPKQHMILVMGVTGSGKSKFINSLVEGAVVEYPGLHSGTWVLAKSHPIPEQLLTGMQELSNVKLSERRSGARPRLRLSTRPGSMIPKDRMPRS